MKTIGITGGKGGTGKSTISTSIAYELSRNHKVLLVDADVDCPNDHLLLGINRVFLKSVEQRIPEINQDKCIKCGKCAKVCYSNAIVAIKNQYPIVISDQCNGCGSCAYICSTKAITWKNKEIGRIYSGKKDNLDFLSGELKPNEPISELVVNDLNDIIEEKKSKYDFIILDTAAGTHCPVIAALENCDEVYCVTEPTPLGEHDLEIMLKLLERLKISPQIIVNRSDIGDINLITKLSKKYDAKIISQIPYSKKIVDSYSNAKPIFHENLNELLMKIKNPTK